jgi:hypothetical protein
MREVRESEWMELLKSAAEQHRTVIALFSAAW